MAYDLPALIRSIPGFAEKTPQECLEYFSEAQTTLKTARYNGNDLMKLEAFGDNSVTVANVLASALQSAGYVLIVGQLTTEAGIDFGDEKTQAMLTTLGQNQAFAPYVDSLKALGQDTRTRWAREGITDDLPDLAEFEEAHADALLVQQKTDAAEALRTLTQAINDRINAGTLTADQIATIQIPTQMPG